MGYQLLTPKHLQCCSFRKLVTSDIASYRENDKTEGNKQYFQHSPFRLVRGGNASYIVLSENLSPTIAKMEALDFEINDHRNSNISGVGGV